MADVLAKLAGADLLDQGQLLRLLTALERVYPALHDVDEITFVLAQDEGKETVRVMAMAVRLPYLSFLICRNKEGFWDLIELCHECKKPMPRHIDGARETCEECGTVTQAPLCFDSLLPPVYDDDTHSGWVKKSHMAHDRLGQELAHRKGEAGLGQDVLSDLLDGRATVEGLRQALRVLDPKKTMAFALPFPDEDAS